MRRKTERIRVGSPLHHVMEYVLLLLGSLIIALSFNLFLNPHHIASGGVTGLSILVQAKLGIEPAITQWALNIPLFLAGVVLLGGKFGVKTAVGSIVLPLFVFLTRDTQTITDNVLLAAVYGGIGVGAGLGLVFRGRGSTGGLDLAAQILHKFTGIRLGLAIAMLDGAVILSAGLVFSPEKALYALIGLFVTSRTIDAVQLGFAYSKAALIISNKPEEMSRAILFELDRGLTKLPGIGGYTGAQRTVLMVVVGQTEVTKLKALVKSIDPSAFLMITNTAEVYGEGFKNVR